VVLRASAKNRGENLDLRGMVDSSVPVKLPDGDVLVAFVDALLGRDAAALDVARGVLLDRLGEGGLTATASIAANFSRNDRIANATGIPLEGEFVAQSEDFREALGINAFASARNSLA
jgi:hypothetical protein